MSGTCARCGKPLPPTKTKPRQYCNDTCRKRYEREHKKLLSTAEGRALHAEWQDDYRLNRLAIHYLTHVYNHQGIKEARFATQILGLLRDGLDLK